jgi:radical SAM protein (TIGR01212 family)
VLKISLNGGFSCPNRDGTLSYRGCLFCDNRSFSQAAAAADSPYRQLVRAIARSSRYSLFLPYLQPYSNTYAPVPMLRAVYEPLLEPEGVIGLAIGTRPDCLGKDVVEYLAELNQRTYVSVEIGLQSAFNDVLARIERGHTVEQFKEAVVRLGRRTIECVAHVMLGLPGQTPQSVADMADLLATLPVDGVKIHQLMIIEGTAFADWHRRGEIDALRLEEYAHLVGVFISRLRPDQCIHRIMADSSQERGLLAPLWSENKARSIFAIDRWLFAHGLRQGAHWRSPSS